MKKIACRPVLMNRNGAKLALAVFLPFLLASAATPSAAQDAAAVTGSAAVVTADAASPQSVIKGPLPLA